MAEDTSFNEDEQTMLNDLIETTGNEEVPADVPVIDYDEDDQLEDPNLSLTEAPAEIDENETGKEFLPSDNGLDTGLTTGDVNYEEDVEGDFIVPVLLTDIHVGKRHRKAFDTRNLEESFEKRGQIQPIVLRINPEYSDQTETSTETKPYLLVAGLNRFTAAGNLHWSSINAIFRDLTDDEAELMEIDENLQRFELTSAERLVQMERRRELYNQVYGIRPGKAGEDDSGGRPKTFTQETAELMGVSTRTIERDMKLAKKVATIDKEALDVMASTPLANNKAELERLAQVPEVFQSQVADIIKSESEAGNSGITVGKAQDILRETEPLVPEPAQETPGEKFIRVMDKLDGSSKYAERILREDIDIARTWEKETQLDFRDQAMNIRDKMEKIIKAFGLILDGEEE